MVDHFQICIHSGPLGRPASEARRSNEMMLMHLVQRTIDSHQDSIPYLLDTVAACQEDVRVYTSDSIASAHTGSLRAKHRNFRGSLNPSHLQHVLLGAI